MWDFIESNAKRTVRNRLLHAKTKILAQGPRGPKTVNGPKRSMASLPSPPLPLCLLLPYPLSGSLPEGNNRTVRPALCFRSPAPDQLTGSDTFWPFFVADSKKRTSGRSKEG